MASLEETREWPPEVIMKLFQLVVNHPILYNPSHEQWSNTVAKGKIWTTIAKELDPNLSSKKCRERFHSNKKKYANEIRKQIAQGADANNYSGLMWLLAEHHEEEKENHSDGLNLGEETKSVSPTNDHENVAHGLKIDGEATTADNYVSTALMDFINQLPPAAETDSSDGEPSEKRRKRKNSIPQKIEPFSPEFEPQEENGAPFSNNNNAFMALLSSLQNQQEYQQKQVEEECKVFGHQVEIDLRRLDPQNRSNARICITKILTELYHRQQN